jgi:peptidoglycan/xylan/chitin deacetylase (PgdA/CDA1 family)
MRTAGRIVGRWSARSRGLGRGRAAALAALAVLGVAGTAAADVMPKGAFAVLCYHDVRDRLSERPDEYTVETQALALQFAWLRAHGYHVIDFDTVLNARRTHHRLPPRSVLLTFDDGLASVYTRVFPLLQAFHYPAIVGLVGDWLGEPGTGTGTPEGAGTGPVEYPDAALTRADFLTPAEIATLQRSGLIEFASHTEALHVGIAGNPQGNLEPAAIVRRFDAARGGYETEADYRARIRTDLERSSAGIARLTGVRPRIIVWPYGAHNHITDALAAEAGMPNGLTLELGFNTPQTSLASLHRILVGYDFTAAALARALQEVSHPEPVRAVDVSLDEIYDPDPAQQEAHLSGLLDRIARLGVNTVYLGALTRSTADGGSAMAYFPNRHLPLRADLFNRVAWQLRTRTGVAVYAGVPLGFRIGPDRPASTDAVRETYADLSLDASFQGLSLSAAPAPAASVPAASVPDGADAAALIGLVRADHDDLKTAWQLEIDRPLPMPGALPAVYAESLFDHVVWFVAARDGHDRDLARWIEAAVRRADDAGKAHADDDAPSTPPSAEAARTVLMLPSSDPSLAKDLEFLRLAGAENLGFFPEDAVHERPAVDALRAVLSLKAFPDDDASLP